MENTSEDKKTQKNEQVDNSIAELLSKEQKKDSGAKKHIIIGLALLVGVIVVFAVTRQDPVIFKGQDAGLVESKIEEIQKQNIQMQQQLLDALKQMEARTIAPPGQEIQGLDAIIREGLLDTDKPAEPLPPLPPPPPPRPRLTERELSMVTEEKNNIPLPAVQVQASPQEAIGSPARNIQAAPQRVAAASVRSFLPAGTIVEGVLQTGVVAPVRGAPEDYKAPMIVIRLTRHGVTPNFMTFPLKDAFVLAKAEGIWNLERVTLDPKKIIKVLPDGRVLEKEITGQIQGADGIDGVQGYLINPGETERMLTFLGGTAAGGFFAGMAQAQQRQQVSPLGTVTTIDDQLLHSIALGLSKTWDNFSQWYLEQAKQALPFVVAEPGQKVYFIVQDGIEFEI